MQDIIKNANERGAGTHHCVKSSKLGVYKWLFLYEYATAI